MNARPLRRYLAALVTTLLLALGAVVVVPSATALGAPVLIDDFAGSTLGGRTVALGPQGTNAQPDSFTQSGGVGTAVAWGDANTRGSVTLGYASSSAVDLTSDGSNAQFFLEMGSITNGASISITLTDAGGRQVSYGTGISEVSAWNVVLNFYCTPTQTVCFTGSSGFSFAQVRNVEVTVAATRNFGGPGFATVAEIRQISTTPLGGAAPPAPTASLALTSPTLVTATDPYVIVALDFASAGQPVDVVPTSGSSELTASDLVLSGTAPGATSATLTPDADADGYLVRVGPITGSGTVVVTLAAGTVRDSWGQVNGQATLSADVLRAVPPSIGGPATVVWLPQGEPVEVPVSAAGVPTPSLAVLNLPPGLVFTDDGDGTGVITGTAAAGSNVIVTASNVAGVSTRNVALNVGVRPAFSVSTLQLRADVGTPAVLTVPLSGAPSPVLTTSPALPAGLVATLASGELRVEGTPTAVGSTTHTLTSTNPLGTASATLVVDVLQPPAITSSGQAALLVDVAGTIEVTATGSPVPALSVEGDLPAGLSFTDGGDGSATVAGTPTTTGTTTVTVRATAEGPDGQPRSTTQELTIAVRSTPVFTSPDVVTLLPGQDTVEITAVAVPTPQVTVADLPDWATATSGDGTLTLTLADAPPGEHVLAVTASNAAGSAQQQLTLRVTQAPTLLSGSTADLTLGEALAFDVVTQAWPAAAITGVDLPEWVTLTDDGDGTATLSGTPPGSGEATLSLIASNEAGDLPVTVTVGVFEAPELTVTDEAVFLLGQPGSFPAGATGWPVPTLTVEGDLPEGLTLVDAGDGTAALAGTPTATGTASVTVVATTRGADGEPRTSDRDVVVEVRSVPVITSPDTVTLALPEGGTVVVTATGYPVPDVTVGDLPSGISAVADTDGTLTLTVTDAAPGAVVLPVTATSTAGTAVQDLTLRLTEAPSLVSPTSVDLTLGEVLAFDVVAEGWPAPAVTADDLPEWVTLTDGGDGTATLTGTPPRSGESTLPVVLTNEAGDVPVDLALRVFEDPALVTADEAIFALDQPGTFEVAATGWPVPSLSVVGEIPAGLTFVDDGDGTGTLAGTPTSVGAGEVTVTASSPGVDGATRTGVQELAVVVTQAPVLEGAEVAYLNVGEAGSVRVGAVGWPVPEVEVSGDLPAGLTLTSAPGEVVLSGTPTAPGDTELLVRARNDLGETTDTFLLRVQQAPELVTDDEAAFTVGEAGTFEIIAAGWPVPALSVVGELPAGLALVDDGDGTATLEGTPTAAGTATVTVVATAELAPTASAPSLLALEPSAEPEVVTVTQELTVVVSEADQPTTPTPPPGSSGPGGGAGGGSGGGGSSGGATGEPGRPESPGSVPAGSIARTGAPVWAVLTTAVLLVAAGGAVLTGRRRTIGG